jgi:tryptophan-rich hypothetical protein
VNKINPKKLLNSKWTAVVSKNKEKHFMVTEIEFNEEQVVISCTMEAVISKRVFLITWSDLKEDNNWLHGWK